jgi:hypothetical protein
MDIAVSADASTGGRGLGAVLRAGR